MCRSSQCDSLSQACQKGGQIIRVMVDMVGLMRVWRDVNGAHSHLVRGGQIAGVILEHGSLIGLNAILRKDRLESCLFRFRAIACMFDAVDRIKQSCQSTRLKHTFRIGRAAIGINDTTAGQGADLGSQFGIGVHMAHIDLMDRMQIGIRVQVVFSHQPCQRGAIFAPVMVAQPVGLGPVHANGLYDVIRHQHLDLVEQAHVRRIKSVVQIEHPLGDVAKGRFEHDAGLGCNLVLFNAGLDCTARTRIDMSERGDVRHMPQSRQSNKDAYSLILEAIDVGVYKPGNRLVESELAERFGVSRTPIREALQRLETQSLLERDGRSLIVASLDHNQMAELYVVRRELEGLAARLAAKHATEEEIRVLQEMVAEDDALVDDPTALARANRRFHEQIHLASHNRYLVQQLDLVHRTMALMATTSLAVQGRGEIAQSEHKAIVDAIAARDEEAAGRALKEHISVAFMTRLKQDAVRREN